MCGCAPITGSSRGFTQIIGRIFKSKSVHRGSLTNPRPDLLSLEDIDADATHPSEHNSVVLVNHSASDAKRSVRQGKLANHMKELDMDTRGGNLDVWETLRAERLERAGHNTAFLMTIPNWTMQVSFGSAFLAFYALFSWLA